MSTSAASRRADSPARAAGTWLRSIPNRTTGRSVTSAKPSAPTIGPRAPPIGVTSRTVAFFRLGSTRSRDQVACQASSTLVSTASVEYDHSSPATGQVHRSATVAVSPDSSGSPATTTGVNSPIPSTTIA